MNTVPQFQKMLFGFAPPLSTTFTFVAIVIVVPVRNIKTASASPSASKIKLPTETVVTAGTVSVQQSQVDRSMSAQELMVNADFYLLVMVVVDS